jgi:acetoin utilization deacetylase AcuC-like enzyme
MLQEDYKHSDDVIFESSPLVTKEELISTHCPIYVDNYLNGNLTAAEIRKTGFPWDRSNVDRSLSSVGGTLAAMRTVMMHDHISIAGHIAGGTHSYCSRLELKYRNIIV